MLLPGQRHQLVIADCTRESSAVTAAVIDVLNDNPDATLHDCEMAFRDAAAHSYIVADGDGFRIVFGMFAWRDALSKAGIEAKDHARLLQEHRAAKA
jgi:hypothetical protein